MSLSPRICLKCTYWNLATSCQNEYRMICLCGPLKFNYVYRLRGRKIYVELESSRMCKPNKPNSSTHKVTLTLVCLTLFISFPYF